MTFPHVNQLTQPVTSFALLFTMTKRSDVTSEPLYLVSSLPAVGKGAEATAGALSSAIGAMDGRVVQRKQRVVASLNSGTASTVCVNA